MRYDFNWTSEYGYMHVPQCSDVKKMRKDVQQIYALITSHKRYFNVSKMHTSLDGNKIILAVLFRILYKRGMK